MIITGQQLLFDLDAPEKVKVSEVMHPEYLLRLPYWYKWRLCYEGGDFFVQTYLKKLSKRESNVDFENRKEISPPAAYAKAAINDIKNSIYQRVADVTRKGGSETFKSAAIGIKGGVDLAGSNMNYFVGKQILPELLVQGKVGVFIDMPHIEPGSTLADNAEKRPYLYMYRAEDIRSWSFKNEDDPTEFETLLLCEQVMRSAPHVYLPIGSTKRYRHLWFDDDGFVNMTFYNENNEVIDPYTHVSMALNITEPIKTKLRRIPFVVAELSDSLMTDIANVQIALMNVESSDISYILHSNVPFYIEQADPNDSNYTIPTGPDNGSNTDGGVAQVSGSKNRETAVGGTRGRSFYGDIPPSFIAPPTDPIQASMAKQDKMKNDIRALVNLALSNIKPSVASAESKAFDERGLESGLSAIGLELENLERKIAIFWDLYENTGDVATIKYPETYSLKSDEERRQEAESIGKLKDKISSRLAKKAAEKQMVDLLFANELSHDELDAIHKEIDACQYSSSDAQDIQMDVETGCLDLEGAAIARGYPPEAATKAKKDAADKLAMIAESQAKAASAGTNPAARGLAIADPDPQSGKKERKKANDKTMKPGVQKPDRGPGKGTGK